MPLTAKTGNRVNTSRLYVKIQNLLDTELELVRHSFGIPAMCFARRNGLLDKNIENFAFCKHRSPVK
jgi:hypothetical protein